MIKLISFQRWLVSDLLLILIVFSHEYIIIAYLNLFWLLFQIWIVLVSNNIVERLYNTLVVVASISIASISLTLKDTRFVLLQILVTVPYILLFVLANHVQSFNWLQSVIDLFWWVVTTSLLVLISVVWRENSSLLRRFMRSFTSFNRIWRILC